MWGEKPEWRKAGQDRSRGAKPHVWVLVSQSMEIPHPLVQGLSVYWLREGSCQAREIYTRSFQPWPIWNKWKPTTLNVCPVLLYEAQELSHHNDKLYRIKIEGGAREPSSGGAGAKYVGNGWEAPQAVKVAQPCPRAKGLEKSTLITSNSVAQTPNAISQAGDFCPDLQNESYWPNQAG